MTQRARPTTFEEWVELNVLPQPAPPPPLPLIDDKLTRWRRDAQQRKSRTAVADAARKARERRGIQEQREFEIALAQANGNNVVDADVLNAIGEALNSLVARVEALEKQVGINNGDKLTTEAVDLPRFLAPKYGTSLGWPENIRFSQPLMTKQDAK
jgi:hypothetical protein